MSNQANISLPSYSDNAFLSLSYYKSYRCPNTLTILIKKPPCYSIGGLAACHLVNDGHNAHPTINSWQPTEATPLTYLALIMISHHYLFPYLSTTNSYYTMMIL
ncbi:N-acetyl-6-hydroxytryptophan oxidase ivoB [Fusarium oxysporum f. sp. albedinis]|nr:N-acetyl-6-hydroxytryptophan oxidase ivoB [Fusarium oxysporum f. sp. albedinis]